MSKVMEDMCREAAEKAVVQDRLDKAKGLLQMGKLSIEEISTVMDIPVEKIKELALAEA